MFSDLIGKTHKEVGGCSGLVTIVCRRLGINLPEWGKIYESHAELEIESRKWLFNKVKYPLYGDLVHIRTFNNNHHIAVVIDENCLLHSTKKHGVHKIRIDHAWLKNRIIGFYRYAKK